MPLLETSKYKVIPENVLDGDLLILESDKFSSELSSFCLDCISDVFGEVFSLDSVVEMGKDEFSSKASQVKKKFTNHETSKKLLEDLILCRYSNYKQFKLYYDVPRVRLIPNSQFMSTGISYNYLPHRDTWYGASESQLNHWISVKNVSKFSTFFIAPSYFAEIVPNSSNDFDLDAWDQKYRPLAVTNTTVESRPHPLPKINIPDTRKLALNLQQGQEIVFSGHHVHGSLPNTTSKLRVSIDFRVEFETASQFTVPRNIDNKSIGNYKKYMLGHSSFG